MPLSPSDRVTLITEIVNRLLEEDWNLIDLILRQFGQSTSPAWNGSKQSYVIDKIELAPDQVPIDMAEHVGFQFGKANPIGIEPPFWRRGMLKVFLSHLAVDRALAGALQECLLEYGISCFVAHNVIEPTTEWLAEIETALATCDAAVALLTPNFHQSNWTDQELGIAMGRGLPVFAVHLGQAPYGFIGKFQAFNGKGKSIAELAKELFDAYYKSKQTQRRVGEVLVNLFEESGSYAQAKKRLGYLEGLEVWQPSFATRIRAAVQNNGQIRDSWGVPARVEQLAKKWSDSIADGTTR
jgi:TIR domain